MYDTKRRNPKTHSAETVPKMKSTEMISKRNPVAKLAAGLYLIKLSYSD